MVNYYQLGDAPRPLETKDDGRRFRLRSPRQVYHTHKTTSARGSNSGARTMRPDDERRRESSIDTPRPLKFRRSSAITRLWRNERLMDQPRAILDVRAHDVQYEVRQRQVSSLQVSLFMWGSQSRRKPLQFLSRARNTSRPSSPTKTCEPSTHLRLPQYAVAALEVSANHRCETWWSNPNFQKQRRRLDEIWEIHR